MAYSESVTIQGVSPFVQTNLDRLPEDFLSDFPLTSAGISDMSVILQGEDLREDPDYLRSLPDLVAMCRAVSRSEVPSFFNPAIRGYHSIVTLDDLRAGVPGIDDDVIFWDLPTNGEPGRCGPMEVCEHGPGGVSHVQRIGGCTCGGRSHYGYLRRYHCDRPQCPDWHCLLKWAVDRAEDATDRLLASDWLMGDGGRMMHVVLSWDPAGDLSWMHSRKAFNNQMRKAYALLMRAGLRGGLGVFHPLRWLGEDSGGVKGMPSDALSNGLSWVLGPHIHVVGYGWLSGETIAEIYAETGIVIRCIASGNSKGDRLGSEDLIAIFSYVLSHAGIGFQVNGDKKALRTLRAFGTLSSQSKSGVVCVKSLTESEPLTCPVCEHGAGAVSHLHDLHGFAVSGDLSPVLMSSHRRGVYCPKVSADRVRADIAGLSPAEIVQYARENHDLCATRCRDPDDPGGLRRFLTPGDLHRFGGVR